MRGPIALSFALALSACSAQLREQIYKADAAPVELARYVRTMPGEEVVRTDDGLDLTGYYWPGAADDRDVIIFFHGRGSNQAVGARYAEYLTGKGDHVLVASYRGFGGNPGKPSEAGLIADGRAFVAKARDLAGPNAQIFLVGHSLGGAVALHVAAHEHVAGVITLSTFDSFAASAPGGMGALLPDKWDNVAAAKKLRAPFVMTYGTADERVDRDQADALFRAAPSPSALVTVPGAGHNPQMDRLAPLITQAVAAIDADAMASYPDMLPEGMAVTRK
ncbi:MAG: alpha/beta fold hydrolase [Sphingobium sp.]